MEEQQNGEMSLGQGQVSPPAVAEEGTNQEVQAVVTSAPPASGLPGRAGVRWRNFADQ